MASAVTSFIGGGMNNTIYSDATSSSINGGFFNAVSGECSAVGGGQANKINGYHSVIGGGYDNSANATFATVTGGRLAYAAHDDSWIWNGSGVLATTDAVGQFKVVAPGKMTVVGTIEISGEAKGLK